VEVVVVGLFRRSSDFFVPERPFDKRAETSSRERNGDELFYTTQGVVAAVPAVIDPNEKREMPLPEIVTGKSSDLSDATRAWVNGGGWTGSDAIGSNARPESL
jgi:hypothetical protein